MPRRFTGYPRTELSSFSMFLPSLESVENIVSLSGEPAAARSLFFDDRFEAAAERFDAAAERFDAAAD